MTEQPPGVAWHDVKVHAEAVVIRGGVPIDDDGNPLPAPGQAGPATPTTQED